MRHPIGSFTSNTSPVLGRAATGWGMSELCAPIRRLVAVDDAVQPVTVCEDTRPTQLGVFRGY